MSAGPSNLLQIFSSKKQFEIFILGMYSGIPLYIIYSTLAAWLKTEDIGLEVITSLAIARVFYSLKVFWAPFIDHIQLPALHRLGRRKSWIMLMMGVVSLVMLAYSHLNPAESMNYIFVLTLFLGAASATLDIAIDAYRIDNIEKDQLSIAAANAVFGYRIGGLASGVGAFYMAAEYGWPPVFLLVSIFYLVGIIFALNLQENFVRIDKRDGFSLVFWKKATIEPFIDFFQRKYSIIILLAIIFYKLGDAMLGVVATPFYLELGFSLKEIAAVVKVFGFIATILGAYVGGVLMYKYGNIKGLFICGVVQSVTNLAFVWLNHQGHDVSALMVAISVENIASGMGDAALIGYLSFLCNKHFSATQYALFSSSSGLFGHSVVVFGGTIVNKIDWDLYFVMTSVLAIPGLLLIILLNYKIKYSDK